MRGISTAPKIDDDKMRKLLSPPTKWPVKVILDTDMNNEIDDQFAFPWFLHSPDKFDIKGICAAPFSFKTMFTEPLTAACKIAQDYSKWSPQSGNEEDRNKYLAQKPIIDKLWSLGVDPVGNRNIEHLIAGAQWGVDTSYGKILELLRVMKLHRNNYTVCRGSTKFMDIPESGNAPVPVASEAADHIIDVANTCTSDDPLYVVAIAAPTNVASAILKDPSIQDKMVVIWDGAYPTCQTYLPQKSLNLSEDITATQILFASAVPLVYIPGFYVGQNIKMSLPDIEKWVKPKGQLGAYLHNAYLNNSNLRIFGLDVNDPGFSWPIYDLACLAWLFDPNFLSSNVHRGVTLEKVTDSKDEDKPDGYYWTTPQKDHKLMREGIMADPRGILYAYYMMMDKQSRVYG